LSPAHKALLYWNTLRYLKPIQIYRRFWFHYHRPSLALKLPDIKWAKKTGTWHPPIIRTQSLYENDTFVFLNQAHPIHDVSDWNNPALPKLWLYNLHYFDDLNAQDAKARREWHRKLMHRWIIENPPTFGNAWEPYPSSLRIVNWVKWALASNSLDKEVIQSLYLQARWLSSRIEWHLLGNHLLANAKALIFAGVFFSGDEARAWLKSGLQIYQAQIPEQILADGMHFELSPMYHAIILEDILDILNLSQAYPNQFEEDFIDLLQVSAQKMLVAHKALIHPDGQISFFNDAAFEIATSDDQLNAYAQSLGIQLASNLANIERQNTIDLSLSHLTGAGYVRLEGPNACAFLDVGAIGPDYLPGHAHADSLSFELSVFNQRVIVNGGTSSYSDQDVRAYERSTAAHSSVEIDGQNSSEVWGQFRVAKRAYPLDVVVEKVDDAFRVSCSHDGYARMATAAIHTRVWQMDKNTLSVADKVHVEQGATPTSAIARFILHPSIQIKQLCQNQWQLLLPNQKEIQLRVLVGEGHIAGSRYAPEFGKTQSTQCLAVKLVGSLALHSQVEIHWA
jgi:uncharacterized heparinase superfamily protein